MLQNRFGFVLLDRLRHHVENIMHHSSTQLQVVVGLNTLLRYRLRDAFAVSSLELTSKEVAKPEG
jgi:hypothetical protein